MNTLFAGVYGASDAILFILSISILYSLIRRHPDDPTKWIPVDNLTYVRWIAGFVLVVLSVATSSRSYTLQSYIVSYAGTAVFIAGSAFFYGAKSPLSRIFFSDNEGLPHLSPKGFYRISRHPAFLGLMLLSLGFALALVSLPGIIVCAFLVLPLLFISARRVDDVWSRRGGSAYIAYSASVPLLLPAFRRGRML